ncbi:MULTISPECIES: ABC transporter substrate-binding protein [Sorangium]|uniref:Sugar ABC transporter substrate-binding protein n=1 Tax=Sorangium cellulosum TaxID=56 RepID=A0A4P2QKZ2_SORCE|nr:MULTISPECIES: extracellular solute-binding protein [Sorangium]AUX30684.1 sugar ABC transporter substrate-binding protein [Sorangium cellulosum]WCQ90073.1 Multiple sugar-binding protein [Sorangium sp. Soce836]
MIGRVKGAALLAALAAAALTLAACDRGGGGEPGGKELRVWHYEAPDSAMGVAWKEAIKEFEATHPGVKVKLEEKGFEQIQKTAPMILNSSSAPDVMEYNKGNATAGLLSKQGLLQDLTPEATKRGWDKRIGPGAQVVAKYDDRGIMGGDKWYGVPNYAEYTLVYYNKDLFKKHDVAVPTTFDELTKAMDAFVAKGVTPLANAGAEYMAQQYVYQLALDKADPPWVSAFQRYTGKTDFTDPAWTHGATTFADWVTKGYIAKSSVSTKAEDAGVGFMSGKFPMMFSGTWWFGRVAKEAKFDWDTFVWPGAKMTLGSGGNLWVVPAGAKNKQLAYDFIDITLKKKIQDILGNAGGVPVAADSAAITEPRAKKLIDGFNSLAQSSGLAYYPDWPVPGFYDQWVSHTQKLMNGDSPQSVLGGIQKSYDSGLPR